MPRPSFPYRSVLLLAVCGGLVTGCTWFKDPEKSDSAATSGAAEKTPGKKAKANAEGEITDAAGMPYYVVKSDFTPLYRNGPQQPNGADQSLPKDTLVTVLKKGYGYTRVQLENGLNGYVATEDLQPAPAERIAPPAPVFDTNTTNNSAIVEHYSVDKARKSADISASNAAAEALPELPEPRLEPEPTPVDKPDFRY